MKRYRFPLEQVRRVRRLQEDAARAAVLAANRGVVTAEAELAARRDRYAAVTAVAPAGTTTSFLAERQRHELAAGTVVAGREVVATAEAAAARRRSEYTAAAMRVGVLDRLDERGRDDHRLDAAREEDREVDDIVVGRAGRVR